ncbi:hypothetical protein HYALB_00007095 [Hymenoscyphus albidus]|uniref:UbiA prenyltransferase n=1 Tax=Hymenoscyphus albidus TaxID=595503 RepID=A0A9N9M3L0_9HELO|nr:hypothetical protein HYALB_00007095 [Hymenoscyphus albidus]
MELQKVHHGVPGGSYDICRPKFSSFPRTLAYHAYTLHLFTCNDLPELVVMPFFFALATIAASSVFGISSQKTLAELLLKVPTMICWNWINLLLFNIHNQRHPESILTDKTSKPWRPIPSKRISAEESRMLLFILYPLMTLFCLVVGGLRPFLAEAVWCMWYNEWNGAKNPVWRNFLNATGIATCMAGPLELVIGDNHVLTDFPIAIGWLVIIGATIFTTNQLQDFRDQDEDRLEGRRTVPIVLGDAVARWVTVGIVIAWSLYVPSFWGVKIGGYLPTLFLGCVLAGHLVLRRSANGDKITWKLWAPWMLSFFLLPILRRYG